MSNLIEGLNKSDAMTLLIGTEGYTFKDAEKYWKENGARSNATGFRAVFYAELIAGADLTDKESFIEFAEANGASDNDIKQYTHFTSIAKLAASVRG